MERALGTEHFAALQKEIGAQTAYHMTEAQAEAVVRLQLGQLAALERDEIFKEFNELRGADPRLRGAARQREEHPRRHPRADLRRPARQVRRRTQDADHRRRIGPDSTSKT